MSRGVICAAADVGANSAHLLVGEVVGHVISPLDDQSALLGLGDVVDAEGRIAGAARGDLLTALAGFAAAAARLGATRVAFGGTEPLRRAADAAAVVSAVERRTGVPLHVLSHDEEGLLVLLGGTAGRPVDGELLLVDIGGGSSELVVAGAGLAARTAGLRVGSSRLARTIKVDDPPTAAQVDALLAAARVSVADVPAAGPDRAIAVGGTASNLAKVLSGLGPDRTVGRERLEEALAILSARPSAETADRFGIRPLRARILPAGVAILAAILERYRLDAVTLSEAGIREGMVLALARAGDAWRDRLGALVLGWGADGNGEGESGPGPT